MLGDENATMDNRNQFLQALDTTVANWKDYVSDFQQASLARRIFIITLAIVTVLSTAA